MLRVKAAALTLLLACRDVLTHTLLCCSFPSFLVCADPILSPPTMAQLIGRVARQGQAKPCYVYHMAVCASIEERMVALRAELAAAGAGTALSAAGSTSGGAGAAVAAAAAAAGKAGAAASAQAGDTNAASTERLTTAQLLRLLDPAEGAAAAAAGSAGAK